MHRPRTLPFLALLGAVLLISAIATPAVARSVPGAPGCPIFPAGNVWNKPVDQLPVRSDSSTLVTSIGMNAKLHPDFSDSDGAGYGIPYNVVGRLTPRYHVKFRWPGESDKGPYPIPANVKTEGGSDRHILAVDRDSCKLYELFAAVKKSDGWHAGSGAIWDLGSNALRPKGWTSADAAGLPILPGLVRYDEVAAGVIAHALRFTADTTRTAYIYPARHQAGDSNAASLPPMGLRVRLKANFDISRFGPQSLVLLTALKTYGMILADNGSPWYVTGAPSPGWNDDELHALNTIPGSAFEAVDTSSLRNTP
jgi:hypothetical protein